MKRFLTPAFIAALALAAPAEELKSTVRFSNNDRLTGSLESLATDRLVWKSPVLEKPTPFFLANVLDLTMAAEQPVIKAGHEASISLMNGDLLRGQIVSVADDSVELDTWYAGRLKFNRLMIADIRIAERPDFIYRGPSGVDGWSQPGEKPAWIYQNGGFRSSSAGGIGRDMKLPDECSISFDAEWRGIFSLELSFFTDEFTGERRSEGYSMIFRQRGISLRTPQKTLGNTASSTVLQENEKARIEVHASLKSGKIAILIDGRLIDVWTDPDVAKNPGGRGIRFVSQNSSPVRISRIEVAAWDGEVGQPVDPQVANGLPPGAIPGADDMDEEPEPAPSEKPKAGRMELRNGDNLEGEVVSIADGRITVKTPFREVKLPLEVLRSIALKPADLERSKLENGDIRCWFPDGSSVVFRLDAVEAGTLTGYSQNFGTARFKISAFSRIEFNIYNRDYEEIRATGGW